MAGGRHGIGTVHPLTPPHPSHYHLARGGEGRTGLLVAGGSPGDPSAGRLAVKRFCSISTPPEVPNKHPTGTLPLLTFTRLQRDTPTAKIYLRTGDTHTAKTVQSFKGYIHAHMHTQLRSIKHQIISIKHLTDTHKICTSCEPIFYHLNVCE